MAVALAPADEMRMGFSDQINSPEVGTPKFGLVGNNQYHRPFCQTEDLPKSRLADQSTLDSIKNLENPSVDSMETSQNLQQPAQTTFVAMFRRSNTCRNRLNP